MSANHVQVTFTEMARAYMDSPKTFIRVNVEEHGLPLDITRELNSIEKLSYTLPLNSKAIQHSPSNMSFYHSTLHPEIVEVQDVLKECQTSREEAMKKENIPIISPSPIQYTDVTMERWIKSDNCFEHCEHINCMKSAIPLSQLKGLQNELPKTNSLQESSEQQVIEKSVHVNLS